MKVASIILSACCLAILLTNAVGADSLNQRHEIELKMGMWNQTTSTRTEIGFNGVSTSVGSNGFIGGLSYGHWFSENLAFTIGAGVFVVDVSTESGWGGVTSETSTVTRLLMSMKYYFPASTYGSSLRPYAIAGAGPFIGSQSKSNAGLNVTVESRTEVAVGGFVGAGVDILLSRHFLTGMEVGFNLASDFKQPIGGSSNYSGPEFTMRLGYVFGKGAGDKNH